MIEREPGPGPILPMTMIVRKVPGNAAKTRQTTPLIFKSAGRSGQPELINQWPIVFRLNAVQHDRRQSAVRCVSPARGGGAARWGWMAVSSEVVRYQVDDKVVAQFEFEPAPGYRPAGFGDTVGWVRDAAAPSIEAARAILDQVKQLAPDDVEVKFGLKVTGTAQWIVAKAASEASFEVTLTWKSGRPAPRPVADAG
jgi:hypothetical protein